MYAVKFRRNITTLLALSALYNCSFSTDKRTSDCAQCEFEHGVPFCDRGECYLIACKDDYRNRDQDDANGCECKTSNNGKEICDGVDNDCDGVIDKVLSAAGYLSLCECSYRALSFTQSRFEQDDRYGKTPVGTCLTGLESQASSGTLACGSNGIWSQCLLGEADLSAFDEDSEGLGILEVTFVANRVEGQPIVKLWYGNYPKRKRFTLLDGSETWKTERQRITKYFVASDAECPVYPTNLASTEPFNAIPKGCFYDGSNASSCSLGKWTTLDDACGFDYSRSTIYLTAEQCSNTATLVFEGLEFTYFDDVASCSCTQGSLCENGLNCNMAAKVPAPYCTKDYPRCAGVCSTTAAH